MSYRKSKPTIHTCTQSDLGTFPLRGERRDPLGSRLEYAVDRVVFHIAWYFGQPIETNSKSKIKVLPASAWLASSVTVSSLTAVTVTGTGCPCGPLICN